MGFYDNKMDKDSNMDGVGYLHWVNGGVNRWSVGESEGVVMGRWQVRKGEDIFVIMVFGVMLFLLLVTRYCG